MITSSITYNGNLRTTAVHTASQNIIITDAPLDNNGKGEAFSPTDLLSTSLACCMLTLMGIAAQTHHINMDGTQVAMTKIMQSNPRKVQEIVLVFNMPVITYSAKEKAILEHAAKTCPVALSLHPDIVQNITFKYQN
jgi:uncharacterized OsmC-like protein